MWITIKKFWISILLCATILFLCFMKTTSLPAPPIVDFDKIVHLLMFLGLSGCIFFDNTSYLRKQISRRRIILGSFLFSTMLSGSIEILQEYCTSYRSGDWLDFLADGMGSFIGALICFFINKRLKA
jgi:VanZ family protein